MKTLLVYIRRRFQRTIALVFICVLITVALFVKLISINHAETRLSSQLISHSYTVTKHAVTIQATLAECESATRGYLLTGDANLRSAIQRSHDKTKKVLSELNGLLKDSVQQARLAGLVKLFNDRMIFLQDVIKHTGKLSPAEATEIDAHARLSATAINRELELFKDRQASLLNQFTHENELATARAQKTVFIGTGVVFLFITGTLLKLNNDVRRRKQSELESRESEKKYRVLIEEAGVTIFTCNLTGIFTYVSGKCYDLTGYTTEELTGQRFSMLVDPDWVSVVTDEYTTQLHQFWNETRIEFPILTRDGQQKWVEQHGVLMLDELHSPVGYQCIVRDITEKRSQNGKSLEVA